MHMKTLSTQDRTFFSLVQHAIFTNPFSKDWLQATAALSPSLSTITDTRQRLQILETVVAERIQDLEMKGIRSCKSLFGEERILYVHGVQFLLFHRFTPYLDHHIQQQLKNGVEPVVFENAREILQALVQFGLTEDEASHSLALFFQMRRAFYFITQIVGSCKSMQTMHRDLWRLIFTDDIALYERRLWNRMEDFSTLLLGETGTGKGVAAKAIGCSGFIPYERSKSKFRISFGDGFIPYNLSQISPQLLESELFGHQKGAFTGAIAKHIGVFGRCSPHGAIFLDEIGEISPQIQIKLLQILQERTFTPVGSQRAQRFSGRVIAATNQDIGILRKKELFRDDFYYRLCTETIRIPSLKKRIAEDEAELGLLVDIVLTRILGRSDASLASKITYIIQELSPPSYHWPGNVRELEQCVRRVLLKGSCDFEVVKDADFLFDMHIPAADLLQRYCSSLYATYNTYEAVARITHLDRRTVKRYIESADRSSS